MLTHRGGIKDPAASARRATPKPSSLDDAGTLARWSAEVRRNTVLLDLLQDLKLEADGADAFLVKTRSGYLVAHLRRPAAGVLESQIDLIEAQVSERETRLPEVGAELDGGLPFMMAAAGLQPSRHRSVLELCDLAAGLASLVCQRFKQAMAVPRPFQLAPQLLTLVPTPEHAAYPAGHATESYAVAHVLAKLIGEDQVTDTLMRTAHRVAYNRTVAGLHYPVDNAAGRWLGLSLAEYLVCRCTGGYGAEGGVRWYERRYTAAADEQFPRADSDPGTPTGAGAAKDLLAAWMWDRAVEALKA
jgi:membrane-associated phospholipid phosphatase